MAQDKSKQRLFEVMGKVNHTFNPQLNENDFQEDNINEETVGEKAHKSLRGSNPEAYQKVMNVSNNLSDELYRLIYDKLYESGLSNISENEGMDAFIIITDGIMSKVFETLGDKVGGLAPDEEQSNQNFF